MLFFLISFLLFHLVVRADDLSLSAKSAILIEESTGNVIYELNPDEKLNPASMTKIMSLILIMEKIDEGKIKLTDDVTVSKEAASMGGSQVYINEGEVYQVGELLKAVAIASANDAVYALSEKVSGSKEKFVEEMNNKAKELNLQNTHFMNPHGLDEENHYSSARDMSIMARELLKHEQILEYTSKYEDYFKKKDGSNIWLVNTNKLVKFYEGMDGLKTGYTSSAGYCLTATSQKDNLRFISVVMGEESIEKRTEDTLKLLNYGFNTVKKEVILDKSKIIDSKKLYLSNKDKVNIYLKNDIVKITNLDDDKVKYKYDIKYNDIKYPIKNGSSIGNIKVTDDKGNIFKEDLVVHEEVKKISFIKLFKRNINIFSSGIN